MSRAGSVQSGERSRLGTCRQRGCRGRCLLWDRNGGSFGWEPFVRPGFPTGNRAAVTSVLSLAARTCADSGLTPAVHKKARPTGPLFGEGVPGTVPQRREQLAEFRALMNGGAGVVRPQAAKAPEVHPFAPGGRAQSGTLQLGCCWRCRGSQGNCSGRRRLGMETRDPGGCGRGCPR